MGHGPGLETGVGQFIPLLATPSSLPEDKGVSSDEE
jgi:hypothetical protein